MEICKNLCNEPSPFDYQSNYIISFKLDPAVIDLQSSYINIPIAINETYAAAVRGGSYANGVSNVGLGSVAGTAVSLATCNIKNIRLKLNGQEVVYTPDINRLVGSLDVFDYNVAEERLEEYFSGNTQTYPSGLESNSALNYSIFRELTNEGSTPSLKFNASVRVQLKKILGGLCDEVRDLRKYSTIELICQLDNNTLFVNGVEAVPPFSGKKYPGAVNDIPWGSNIPGGKTQGANTWTSTDVISIEDFPFGVGDTVQFTVTADSVIQNVALNGGGGIVLTLSKNADAGDLNLLGTSVGTFKQFKLTGTTVNQLLVDYPINSPLAFFNGTSLLSTTATTLIDAVQSGNNVLIVLSSPVGVSIGADTLTEPPLLLSYNGTPGNGVALPDDLSTVSNYTTSTFPLWVGCPCIVSGVDNITNMSTVISKIDYNGGKARLTFSPKVTATGAGAIDGLCVIPQMASSLALTYPDRWELVQYRMLNRPGLDKIQFNNAYKKWMFDADTIQELQTYGIYEKTFLLEPLTDCVVICLCSQNGIVSDIGNLASYRLRLDGVDTTSREILLSPNGDPSYKFERLLNGFQYLSGSNLGALATNPNLNPLASNNSNYVILQDLVVDGNSHKLTVSIVNGGTSSYATRNIRIYKSVRSMLP
jgi:hypothetical protein